MLSFIKPPAPRKTRLIGNDRCGVIEVEERGGLTVGEGATISELLAEEQSSFVRGAQIADQIATEEQISLSEAFSIVEKAISGQQLEDRAESIRVKHAERIAEVARVYALAGLRSMEATVTAVVRSRCGAPDWSMSDTRKMDKALFEGLWQLAREEQEAEGTPAEPPSAEDLGKPRRARGKSPEQTGQP